MVFLLDGFSRKLFATSNSFPDNFIATATHDLSTNIRPGIDEDTLFGYRSKPADSSIIRIHGQSCYVLFQSRIRVTRKEHFFVVTTTTFSKVDAAKHLSQNKAIKNQSRSLIQSLFLFLDEQCHSCDESWREGIQ